MGNRRSFGSVLLILVMAALPLIPSIAQHTHLPIILIAQQAGEQNTTTATTVAGNETTTATTETTTNVTATNTTNATAPPPEEVTAGVTTVTVVSYITLPPVTRPPSNMEIASWISGGAITGILIGLSLGYAIFAKGVSIKKQQSGGKVSGKPGEKRKK